MKVTISEYGGLERDENRQLVMACPLTPDVSTTLTADNNVTLAAGTEMIRVWTDTKIYVDSDTTDANSPVMPANAVEVFTCNGGDTVYIAAVV